MSLQTLFNPKSIAVIGASTTPGSVGHILVENLINEHFPGKIFPVNPKATTLLGIPCYQNIRSIQEAVDVAIIAVPAAIVPTVLEEVAQTKIKAVIIISAGFKEAGVKGKVLEQQVKDIAEKNNIILLGPNCLGFLHASRSLNASFAKGLPKPGNITFFSQSGALCTTILDETRDALGYAHFVSIGNKATTQEQALLDYFITDPETSIIAMYTEDLKESSALIELGKKAILQNPPKPIIALKSGATEAGGAASSSHTGAVAGSNHAYDTLFKQAYITRAKNLSHLTNMLSVFSQNPLPVGNRLAIITNAGGMGVLATDAAIENGLTLAALETSTTQDLSLSLPAAAGTHNPIDVLGDAPAERYMLALNLASKDPNVDMILVIVTPQAMTEATKTAEAIIKIRTTCKKPIVAVFTNGKSLEAGVKLLQKASVAVLDQPEEAAEALASLARVTHWNTLAQKQLTQTTSLSISEDISSESLNPADNTGYVKEELVRHTLEKAGFHFPKTVVVTSEQEIASAVHLFDSAPVVLKIISPDIIHKSDVGGVVVNVTPKDILKKYQQLLKLVSKNVPDAKIEGVLVAEMIPPSNQEILLGIKQEPGLGKLVVLGMGGIYVEVLHDVTSRFAPVSRFEAQAMISELRSAPLLTGARGQAGVNTEKLIDAIVALSNLALTHPEIQELDINPLVFTSGDEFVCLDARIRVSIPEQSESSK